MSFHRKYQANSDTVIEIVAEAKRQLLAKEPGLKLFESEIGAYIARAVEQRNEQGMVRPESAAFLSQQSAISDYHVLLAQLAAREAQKCKKRFAHKLQDHLTKEEAFAARLPGGVQTVDDYDSVIGFS